MNSGFFFERGKYLFEEGEKDPFAFSERSKSFEHSSYERSKSGFTEEIENTQKLKIIEENKR